jgi:WhiB family transcriptional regulator, redox-sensing transcriptional regulator
LFFPIAETRAAQRQIRAAKMVCARCGVSALCMAYALDTEYEGIWGGTTWQERVAARRHSRAGASRDHVPGGLSIAMP